MHIKRLQTFVLMLSVSFSQTFAIFYAVAQPLGANENASLITTDSFSKQFLITFVDYPGAEPYLDVLNEIYTELGFTVHKVPAPALRGLQLVNEGKVDADAHRLGRVAARFENVMLIKPELVRATLVLLCRSGVECNRNILNNKEKTLLTNERSLIYLEDFDIQTSVIKKEIIINTVDMLRTKRADYATFMIDERQLVPPGMQYVKLRSIFLYHTINKKHAHLLPKIEAKMRTKRLQLNEILLSSKS
ncbi:hypothetical protein FX988_01125 [Paraglaciecola mesophila]|uniref:Solute-binding protein family 3/N-terminal domain-containing protein n=1 Tax=Paraglaciecola mesophila TaxID=197222 RepID=A0A857JFY2_9ALTE|nr:hypothetical protein [Paraglaciecola mesophila]QHJ10903.1 hypothetical protein FX988_01125 [Paraglaciecola mesophila]